MTIQNTSPPPRRRMAEARRNQDFICIETYSGYASSFRDPEGKQYLFSLNVSDKELGEAVLDALAASRFLPPEIVTSYTRLETLKPSYEIWQQVLMDRFSYKTKGRLFKKMIQCGIEERDGIIVFTPTHHDRLEGWAGLRMDEAEGLILPSGSSPEEIGAALQLAFRRCTGPGALGE